MNWRESRSDITPGRGRGNLVSPCSCPGEGLRRRSPSGSSHSITCRCIG